MKNFTLGVLFESWLHEVTICNVYIEIQSARKLLIGLFKAE